MRDRPFPSALIPAALPLFFLLILPARGGEIPRLSLRLEPEEVAFGGKAVLTVSVSWEGDPSGLIFARPDPPSCRGLEVTSSTQRSIAYRDGDTLRQIREFIFTLRGEVEGTGRVGPVRLSYRRPPGEEEFSLATNPLEVMIVSSRPGSALPLPGAVILALGAAVLAAFYILYWVGRYQKKSNEMIADYVENLEAEALRELEGARKHRLEGETDKYREKLRTVLAGYLEKKNAVSRRENGGETMAEDMSELAGLLRRLDELRFGGHREEKEELDEIYRRAEAVLRSRENDFSRGAND